MLSLPQFGLVLALLGVPLFWAAFRFLKIEVLGILGRISLWLLAVATFAIAVSQFPDWRLLLGISSPTWLTVGHAAIGIGAILTSWPAIHLIQRKFGTPFEQTANFKKVSSFPFSYRSFIVITAGVTEEVLYRGYAIGVGNSLLGSLPLAVALSLTIFVALHLRWGLGHLISVIWAGGVFTLMFIITNDLVACIAAHIAVDAIGLLIVPWLVAMKEKRTFSAARGA